MLAPRAGTAEPIARSGFRSGRDGDKDCSIILRNQQGSLTLPGERTLRQACLGLDRPSPVDLGSRATSIFVVAVRQETAFDLITHITKQATIAKCPSRTFDWWRRHWSRRPDVVDDGSFLSFDKVGIVRTL